MEATGGLHAVAPVDRRSAQKGRRVLEGAGRIPSQFPGRERLSVLQDDESPLAPMPPGGARIAPPIAVYPHRMGRARRNRRRMRGRWRGGNR